MYMSNSTLEKLVEILRKKVNGATATETVSKIRDVLVSSACPASEDPTKEATNRVRSPSSSEDEEDGAEDEDADENVDDEKIVDVSTIDKSLSTACDSKDSLVIDSSLNLSGPVTDL
ncbi:uncharacterized protein [Linepithema humile]|uniref:uncharacterized protein n=1 Tax=Linepithema humile TaxID=83485 RepID=UPI00351F1246